MSYRSDPQKNFAKGRYIIAIFWTPGPLDRCLEMTKMAPSDAMAWGVIRHTRHFPGGPVQPGATPAIWAWI